MDPLTSICAEQNDPDGIRAELPQIRPEYFASNDHQLCGIHYFPTGNSQHHAVVFAAAYGHENERSHRCLQKLAVQLAQCGLHVLRFDYSCTGNSSGRCDAADAKQWQIDLQSAVEHTRRLTATDRCSVIGLRLGATLATMAELPNLESLILWDPVFTGEAFCDLIFELHRSTVANLPARKQRSSLEQALGYRMTIAKRNSFLDLKLQTPTDLPQAIHLVTTKNYLDDDCLRLAPQAILHKTQDEANWDQAAYLGTKLNAPQSLQRMLDTLSGASYD